MRSITLLAGLLGLVFLVGCKPGDDASPSAGRVVLYTAVDRPYVEPIIAEFEKQTGIKVDLQTDAEAAKTTGLVNRLIAEKDNPQADVWWSNEIFHSSNLARAGLLAPYQPATASEIDVRWRRDDNLFTPVALRARVIVLNANPANAELLGNIKSLQDLADPRLKGKIAIALPKFGTTGGHVASLYQVWGEQQADEFFKRLHDNGITILGGNMTVVDYVAAGQMLAGFTDNDDVAHALSQDKPVRMVVPDQGDGELGTLLIPTTVGLVKGAPNEANAKKLIDYLTSKAVEQSLIDMQFALFSVRTSTDEVQSINVDYDQAAANMHDHVERSIRLLRGE